MQKSLSKCLLAAALLAAGTAQAKWHHDQYGNIWWETAADEEAPETLTVPTFGAEREYLTAITGADGLKELTFPGTLGHVDGEALETLTSLRKVTVEAGDGMLFIAGISRPYSAPQDHAAMRANYQTIPPFKNCPLEEVDLARDVSAQFSGSRITKVTLRDGVENIQQEQFRGISSQKVVLPSTLKTIHESAFYGSKLVEISIPASVSEIKAGAFSNCTSLETVTIEPATSTIIIHPTRLVDYNYYDVSNYVRMFESCPVKTLNIGRPAVYYINSGYGIVAAINPFAKNKTLERVNVLAPGLKLTDLEGCPALKSVCSDYRFTISTLPKEVWIYVSQLTEATAQAESQLAGGIPNPLALGTPDSYTYLIKADGDLTIDGSIHEQGSWWTAPAGSLLTARTSAADFVSLRGIDITTAARGDGYKFSPTPHPAENIFTVIDKSAAGHREIKLENAGDLISKLSLDEIPSITSLTLSGPINGTDILTINRMPLLKAIDLNGAVIKSGGNTYHTDYTTQDNIVGTMFFAGCKALEAVWLPASATAIADEAFKDQASLQYVDIPFQTTTIGKRAFENCASLTAVDMPYVATIKDDAFSGAINLRRVSLPNIETMGSAFNGCPALEEIVLPASLTQINCNAFKGCTSLRRVVFEEGDLKVHFNGSRYDGKGVFSDCPVEYVELGRNPGSIDQGRQFRDVTTLRQVVLHPNVADIPQYCFYGCKNLESIDLSATQRIGKYAFAGCESLKSAHIDFHYPYSHPNVIEEAVFAGCSALERVVLGDNNFTISSSAFKDCTSLREIELPSVFSIRSGAFSGCNALARVICQRTTPPALDDDTFDDATFQTAELLVPRGSMAYYWLDPVWCRFANMKEIENTLEDLPALTYGDAPINLDDYAAGVTGLKYESSDPAVAAIDGSRLIVKGTGSALIRAYDPSGIATATMARAFRKISIAKASLGVTVAGAIPDDDPDFIGQYVLVVRQNEPWQLTPAYIGLCYDDDASALSEAPEIECATSDPKIGTYLISFSGGKANNYELHYLPTYLKVIEEANLEEIGIDSQTPAADVYDINGRIVLRDASPQQIQTLVPGIYIIAGRKMMKH